MADAEVSKAFARKGVWVRLPPAALVSLSDGFCGRIRVPVS
jgi:hypothetical protein